MSKQKAKKTTNNSDNDIIVTMVCGEWQRMAMTISGELFFPSLQTVFSSTFRPVLCYLFNISIYWLATWCEVEVILRHAPRPTQTHTHQRTRNVCQRFHGFYCDGRPLLRVLLYYFFFVVVCSNLFAYSRILVAFFGFCQHQATDDRKRQKAVPMKKFHWERRRKVCVNKRYVWHKY